MLAHKPGLQPEDYEVLIRLLLRDPGLPSGILALSEEFQASGWKTGASRLRGVVQRLKKAGHVRHTQAGYGPATGRPRWEFAVYRNPANNPQYVGQGLDAASQVSPMVRKPTRWSRPPTPLGEVGTSPSPTAAPAVTRAPGHRLRRGSASMCFVKREGGFDLGFDLLRGA